MSGESGTRDRVEHSLGCRFEEYARLRLADWPAARNVPDLTREALQAKLRTMRRPHQAWLNRFADHGEVGLAFLRDRLLHPRLAWALAGLVAVAVVARVWWMSEASARPSTLPISSPSAASSSRIRFSATSSAGIPRFPMPSTLASRTIPDVPSAIPEVAPRPLAPHPETQVAAKVPAEADPARQPGVARPVSNEPIPKVEAKAPLSSPEPAVVVTPSTARVAAREWRFVRSSSGAGARRNLNSPALPDVLREFAVVQTDDGISLVDADGSVYPLSFDMGGRATRAGSAARAALDEEATEEEGVGFQAVGVHRTTGEAVVLRGRLIARHSEGLPVRAAGGVPAFSRLAMLAKGDFIIRGEIQYGERTRFRIEAAPLDGAI